MNEKYIREGNKDLYEVKIIDGKAIVDFKNYPYVNGGPLSAEASMINANGNIVSIRDGGSTATANKGIIFKANLGLKGTDADNIITFPNESGILALLSGTGETANLPVAKGGTGRVTLDPNELLYGSITGAMASLDNPDSRKFLVGTKDSKPAWGEIGWTDITVALGFDKNNQTINLPDVVAKKHTQNTDQGTSGSSFYIGKTQEAGTGTFIKQLSTDKSLRFTDSNNDVINIEAKNIVDKSTSIFWCTAKWTNSSASSGPLLITTTDPFFAPTTLNTGIGFSFIMPTGASPANPTIRINGGAEIDLYKNNGLRPGYKTLKGIITIRYNGASFYLVGEGGEYSKSKLIVNWKVTPLYDWGRSGFNFQYIPSREICIFQSALFDNVGGTPILLSGKTGELIGQCPAGVATNGGSYSQQRDMAVDKNHVYYISNRSYYSSTSKHLICCPLDDNNHWEAVDYVRSESSMAYISNPNGNGVAYLCDDGLDISNLTIINLHVIDKSKNKYVKKNIAKSLLATAPDASNLQMIINRAGDVVYIYRPNSKVLNKYFIGATDVLHQWSKTDLLFNGGIAMNYDGYIYAYHEKVTKIYDPNWNLIKTFDSILLPSNLIYDDKPAYSDNGSIILDGTNEKVISYDAIGKYTSSYSNSNITIIGCNNKNEYFATVSAQFNNYRDGDYNRYESYLAKLSPFGYDD